LCGQSRCGCGKPPDAGSPDVASGATIAVTVVPALPTATASTTGNRPRLPRGRLRRPRGTATTTSTSTPTAVKTVTVTSTSTSTAGVAVSVSPQNGYNLVTIAYPAAWSCPSDTSLPSSIPSRGHVAHRPFTQRYRLCLAGKPAQAAAQGAESCGALPTRAPISSARTARRRLRRVVLTAMARMSASTIATTRTGAWTRERPGGTAE